MGVKGLTSFIEQQHNLIWEWQLHDTKVIIDGYGCMFYLYSAHLDHGHHGGEYGAYEDKCRLFFTNLLKCNIAPYVVFDGAYDLDDKKLSTLRSRCEDRIKFAGNIADGRSGYLLPVLTEHVLKKVIADLGIPSVVCDFEADNEIAALANAWNCPVLGRDSDFFIMDIKAGYLPLEMINWNYVRKKKTKVNNERSYCYLTAAKYTLSKFCKHYSIKRELIPILATVTGNDYMDPICINQFLMQIYQRQKKGRNTKKHGHLYSVLDWLSEQDTIETCLQTILRCVKTDQRCKVRTALETSLSMYIPSDNSKLALYFADDFLSSFSGFSDAKISIPRWCLVGHRRGDVPSSVINIMCSQRVFALTQVENHAKPSANELSQPIRQVLYGILLHRSTEMLQGQQSSQSSRQVVDSSVRRREVKKRGVVEYDRSGRHVKCNEIAPSYDVPNFGAVIPIQDVPRVDQSTRRNLLLAVLGIDHARSRGQVRLDAAGCGAIPACFHLPIFVVVYWLSHADPKANVNHLRALLLCWVHCLSEQILKQRDISSATRSRSGDNRSSGSFQEWNCAEARALLDIFSINVEPKMKSYTLDIEAAHGFAQMQSCLKATVHLNATLQHPFPEPDVSLIYSGRLLHGLYATVKGIPGGDSRYQSWIQSNLFHRAPTALALYNAMNQYITCHIGSEALYVPAPRKKKRRGGQGGRVRARSQGGRRYGDVVAQANGKWQVCNKFTGLVLEGDDDDDEDGGL